MTVTEDTETATFPKTLEGWRARAIELESLLKVEKLSAAKLRLANQSLRDRLYGRKSEKITDAQRELFGILPFAPPPPLSEEAKRLMAESRKSVNTRGSEEPKRKGGGRNMAQFEELPLQVDLIHPTEEQRAGKVWADVQTTEHLEIIPSKVIRHLTFRSVWMDPKHGDDRAKPAVAPLPAELKVFPNSRYGLSFMVAVIIAKFCDHLPLYRQAGMDARLGAWISRQARGRIVNCIAHLLISIHLQLKQKALLSDYLHIDETITKVLDKERRGRSHDAFLWGFLAPHEKTVYLEFSKLRKEKTLFDFFPSGWKGLVHTDGHEVYPSAFNDMPFVTHLECIGHLRSYVRRALVANEALFKPIMADILALYRIERRANKVLKLTHEQRGLYRHALAKPLLKRLQKAFWDLEHDPKLAEKLEGAALEAVTYANARGKKRIKADDGANLRWRRLALYARLGNGRTNIDQNPVENSFRPTKLGMKNWLFIGRPEAGWRAAVLYSVLGTCRLLNVNPEAYLRWVLPQLAEGTNKTTATGLLPHDFARLFPEHVMAPLQH